MQDALKVPGSAKKTTTLDMPPRPMKVTEARNTDDDSESPNVLWKQDIRKKADALDRVDTAETVDFVEVDTKDDVFRTSAIGNADQAHFEAQETKDLLDARAAAEQNAEVGNADSADASEALDAERDGDKSEARWIPTSSALSDTPKTPWMAIAAGVAALLAGWSYATLEETRSKLALVTEAKASVDRSLAEAQARLSAAEKAVADVKAALSMTPAITAGAAAVAPKKAATTTGAAQQPAAAAKVE